MTQYTGPGTLGYARPYNPADWTTDPLDIPATGQWTGPGKWGAPGAYNDSDWTTGAVTPGDDYVLVSISATGVLSGVVSPFDERLITVLCGGTLSADALMPPPFETVVDVDDISVSLSESYNVRVSWI